MSIPSKDGSEDLGYSYKYKGKKCCKISLTSDTNGIVRLATVEPGNMHDARILRESIGNIIPTAPIQCLADSGYIGIGLYNHCVDCNIELIAQPRKKNNGEMTHTLTPQNIIKMKKYRSTIEHVNS